MMNNLIYLFLALVVGILLGTLFFGGLWFTVKKLTSARMPALLVFVSLVLRLGITLTVFYFIAKNNWQQLVICLIGFIIARVIIIRVTKKIDTNQIKTKEEVCYET